jgi:hypothetical protein
MGIGLHDDGYDSPEEAAMGDIPERFVTVPGVRIDREGAHVWMLTNDRPSFEPYEVECERPRGRWLPASGSGGFGGRTPAEILERAAKHAAVPGWPGRRGF